MAQSKEKESIESVLEKALMVDILDEDFKITILKTLN